MRGQQISLRIVVLGYVVRGPLGGMAWHHLQYVLGLAKLGHEVLFLEDSDDYESCYDPSVHTVGVDPTYGLRFARAAFESLGLEKCWAYYDAHQKRWHGPAGDNATSYCNDAELLINVSGVNPIRPCLENIPVRALIDTDPVFTQVRHLTDQLASRRASQHNAFFTFGELVGTPQCAIPDDHFPWQPTRQPVVLNVWPFTSGPSNGAFTTVMQWESYPQVTWNGRRFGMKSQSFEALRDLPGHVETSLELALGGHTAPRRELQQAGWRLADSLAVTRDLWTYQAYVRQSRGELSVAKHGYVAGRSGWFSERTACYLASGRPVVVQDTGFSQFLPCSEGLWAFSDAASAIAALHQIDANYNAQCHAARSLAETYFNSDQVLTSLIERAFASTNTSSRAVVR
jgi:hypothetical protein